MSDQYNEIIKIIRKQKYYIYGAGKVSDRFYRFLEAKQLLNNFSGFVVTTKNKESHMGEKLYTVYNLESNPWVLVATDYTSFLEIQNTLHQLELRHFIWIYPYLYDFFLGVPIKRNVSMNIASILKKNFMANWISVCYIALQDYKLGKEEGKKIYLKVAEIFFKSDVANCRFVDSAKKMEQEGYSQEYPIKINSDEKLLLDGAHRIALAIYFKQKNIVADLYNCSLRDYRDCYGVNKESGILVTYSEDSYLAKQLDEKEMAYIKETIKQMISLSEEIDV